MSVFKINLKTKNGNDIKAKQTFTVFFRVKYGKNALTKKTIAEYTYRIVGTKATYDKKVVLEIKDPDRVKSLEDLTMKVMLNMCHLIGQISQKEDSQPDFVLFISPDFNADKNEIWKLLRSVFDRKAPSSMKGVKEKEIGLLSEFVKLNKNTKFMNIDPNRDPQKYAKSIVICTELLQRLNRQHEDLFRVQS